MVLKWFWFSGDNLLTVSVRIHQAVGRISGDGHQAAKLATSME